MIIIFEKDRGIIEVGIENCWRKWKREFSEGRKETHICIDFRARDSMIIDWD